MEQRMACPQCGHVNSMLVVANDVMQFVCSQCQMVYYGPSECISDEKTGKKPDKPVSKKLGS